MTPLWLPVTFALTALIYAMVGFGGGSTYAALLSLTDLDYAKIPVLVLVCNIVVVTGGVIRYLQAKLLNLSLAWPLVLTSVPCAWLGGRIPIAREYFLLLLGVSLLVSGVMLVWQNNAADQTERPLPSHWKVSAPVMGASLGFLAGLVGIGGGIFLAPLLHHLRITTAKAIAAMASFFILVNSLSGLAGQLTKQGWMTLAPSGYGFYLWLPLAVLIGGQIGSRMSVSVLPGVWVRKMTGVLVVVVGIRLLSVSGLTFYEGIQ